MKYKISLLIFIIVSCNGNWAKDPAPKSSISIAESRKDKVFLHEYQPQLSYIGIEGKKYKIKEAWVEHPHLERTEGHLSLKKDYVFVMTFDLYLNDTIDFSKYTKDLATGNSMIWFFLNAEKKEDKRDTLILYYKERLNSTEQKQLFLYKKSPMD